MVENLMHFLDCAETLVNSSKMKGSAAGAESLKEDSTVDLARPVHPPSGVGADLQANASAADLSEIRCLGAWRVS